jgi:hypothetical protein
MHLRVFVAAILARFFLELAAPQVNARVRPRDIAPTLLGV